MAVVSNSAFKLQISSCEAGNVWLFIEDPHGWLVALWASILSVCACYEYHVSIGYLSQDYAGSRIMVWWNIIGLK